MVTGSAPRRSLPVIPGGIGIIEGSLAVILVGYGAGRAAALAATLGFRLVSFWLAVAVGWIAVAAIADGQPVGSSGRRRTRLEGGQLGLGSFATERKKASICLMASRNRSYSSGLVT